MSSSNTTASNASHAPPSVASTVLSSSNVSSNKVTSVSERAPRLVEEIHRYTKTQKPNLIFQYGTAGFRCDASLLDYVVHRMGMIAILRSKCTAKITGIMVTASHNPPEENGIKLIDPRGEVLSSDWEKFAMDIANAPPDKVTEIMDQIIAEEKIDMDTTGNVFVARDTRPSSEHLAELAREGALAIGGNVLDFGLQTTPQLHHLVRMWNYETYNKGDWASEVGYYNMLADAFKQLTASQDSKKLEMRTPLYVDCARGVGALQVAKLAKELGEFIHLEICNLPSDGELNRECGAEFVHKTRKPPVGFLQDSKGEKRCCSLDGDADRVIFHYFNEEGEWHILDGDKIACLFATHIQEIVQILEMDPAVRIGCVQTAYSNGASTQYFASKGIEVACAETGVKNCHEKALEYDIGIYFEACGHGTALFKDDLMDKLHKWESSCHDARKKQAISQLIAIQQLLNQATGDGISNLLFVEALLMQKHWSIADWDKLYTDLPTRQTKVPVEANTSPSEWTNEMFKKNVDEIIQNSAHPNSRAFVRFSGTESAVRVFVESDSQEACDTLALQIAQWAHKNCNGVGSEPTELGAEPFRKFKE